MDSSEEDYTPEDWGFILTVMAKMPKGTEGEMPCPKCGSVLHYSRAVKNKRSGVCTTLGCIKFVR